MIVAMVALLVLAAGVVALVGQPFLRPSAALEVGSDGEQARRELLERRDATLAALQELEQDRAAGRLTETDFERERATLRAEAATLLRSLDADAAVDRDRV